jgi:hypothetical protein
MITIGTVRLRSTNLAFLYMRKDDEKNQLEYRGCPSLVHRLAAKG